MSARPLGRFTLIDDDKIFKTCGSFGYLNKPKVVVFDVGTNPSAIESMLMKENTDK